MDDAPSTPPPAGRTVAQVAKLAGITVRTLHHYDQIGLLAPSARSDAAYRLYSEADVTRLREILTWRRLDVPLAQIAQLLDDPAIDRDEVLRRQRSLVARRIDELRGLEAAIDRALDHTAETGATMDTDQDIIDALGGFDPADHDAEARERWGDTDAFRESTRRTKEYTADDWRRSKVEAESIHEALAALWQAGADPAGDEALAQAEAFRAHVTRWFYDCPPELLRGLGEMYVADPRFTATYDGPHGERAGFAAWVRDAWAARADQG
ncbi:MAG: transcriptional regulator [Thermoleophilia bacterium]|nr:transcriptional regulator [Thermoleophilia bacterium]